VVASSELQNLPIFPLENVVLFPHVRAPLVIFEPRYRQMTRDALAGGQRIGMVVVRSDHTKEMAGDPPIFEIGCEGEITSSQKLEDGRYNIELTGRSRFRILEEPASPPEQLYRWARIERLEDANPSTDGAAMEELRHRIGEQVLVLARRMAGDSNADLNPKLFNETDDVVFTNVLSQSLNFSAIEKQGLLEADSIRERAEQLADLLDFRIASIGAASSPGPDTRH